MRAVSILVVLFCVAAVARSTPPPPPEPIQKTFQALTDDHIPMCERLIHELRERLSPAGIQRLAGRLEVLDRYLSNVSRDDVFGFRRALDDSSAKAIPYWSDRIVTDVVGFRRVFDQIIIEALASGDLRSDEKFLNLVRVFWEKEYGITWRFGVEASPQRP